MLQLVRAQSPLRRSFCSVVGVFNERAPSPRAGILRRQAVGLFGIPELTSAAGFDRLRRDVEAATGQLVEEALSSGRSRKLVSVLDELSDRLCRVADMADCMRVLHPDRRHREGAEAACGAVMRLVEQLNTDAQLYAALKPAAGGERRWGTDAVDERVAALLLADFELSGIHLETAAREAFVQANERAFSIGAHFMQATAEPRLLKKSTFVDPEVKKDFFYHFLVDREHVKVSGDLSHCPSPLTREMAYRMFYWHEPLQEERLEGLLEARHDLAVLTGFEKSSDRATRHTMAGSAENVKSFLKTLHEQLPLTEEFELLRRLKKEMIPEVADEEVKMWDIQYLIPQARVKMSGMEQEALRKYFSLGHVMEALRLLSKDLFGVNFRVVRPSRGELWHRDVFKVEVEHEDEGPLGIVYMDLFQRSGKPFNANHCLIRGGRQLPGSYQQPIVTLFMSLSQHWNNPTVLDFSEVENVFHEFGHALHSILGRTRYQHVTGSRTSTDFAEVPSTLMESFAFDSRVLERYARHYWTDEVLPKEVIDKLEASRNLLLGVEVRQQLMYAVCDQALHGSHPLDGSPSDVARRVHNAYFPVPFVDGSSWCHRFPHFLHYGAKYYSYLMARSVAQRLWKVCFVQDPFSREAGERYRREMLAFGGERPPAELFYNLTGERLTTETMAAGLVDTICGSSDEITRNYLAGM